MWRVRFFVALAALAGAAIAAGVAAYSGGDEEERSEPVPLELGIVVAGTPEAEALVEAERLYEEDEPEEALDRFLAVLERSPNSAEAAVGAAVAAGPGEAVDRLRDLVAARPASGVARLHLGLALFTAGDREAADAEWREVERRDPDTPSALRAEDLLHPEMPVGRPFFVPEGELPGEIGELAPPEQLEELRLRAERGDTFDRLLYGSVLQRLGRPVSAREAFDEAVELDPESVPALTAAAVVRFDKDDPSQAFSRLGPLAGANPREPVVRFHLGLMLLWLRQVDEARAQLELARQHGPTIIYGREARILLDRLESN